MTVIGKKYICDRCKTETFVRYIGTKEMDGGWTQIQNFEKPEMDLGTRYWGFMS